jgi:hypothetical protein
MACRGSQGNIALQLLIGLLSVPLHVNLLHRRSDGTGGESIYGEKFAVSCGLSIEFGIV